MNKKYLCGGGGLLIIFLFFYCKGPAINNWEISKPDKKFTQIIFLGDSLTSGFGLKDSNKSFPKQIGQSLNLPVKIFGYPGYTTADGLKKIDILKNEEPSLVILTLGGNDILRRKNLKETQENLKTIFAKIQSWKHTLVYTEVLSVFDGKRHIMHIELCKANKVCMVPDILSGMISDQNSMQADSIHPNENGCRIIADRVIKVLKENKFFD